MWIVSFWLRFSKPLVLVYRKYSEIIIINLTYTGILSNMNFPRFTGLNNSGKYRLPFYECSYMHYAYPDRRSNPFASLPSSSEYSPSLLFFLCRHSEKLCFIRLTMNYFQNLILNVR